MYLAVATTPVPALAECTVVAEAPPIRTPVSGVAAPLVNNVGAAPATEDAEVAEDAVEEGRGSGAERWYLSYAWMRSQLLEPA